MGCKKMTRVYNWKKNNKEKEFEILICEGIHIVSEKEIIQLSNQGYDCQMIGSGKWLMRKKLLGQLPS